MSVHRLLDRLGVRSLLGCEVCGKPVRDGLIYCSGWWDLTYAIGSAWQLGHLSDDEAKDLETMLRSYRFPRK